MKIDQVHMRDTGAGIEVTIRRGKTCVTSMRDSWGLALALVNFATAWNGAPEPTPPEAGTPTVKKAA